MLNITGFCHRIVLAGTLLGVMTACTSEAGYPPPPISGSQVVIDVKHLKPGTPLYFTHKKDGKNINFFVLMAGEKVRSFFDACVTCYPKKRGYRDDGGTVVCRACNQRFPVSTLEKGIGGCYPIKIPGVMKDESYRIPLSRIEEGAKWF